jgi:hypothetical protein
MKKHVARRVKRSLAILGERPKVERQVAIVSPQRAVIATENPIQRWDEETKQVVNEVLLMDGIVWRGGRDQIPIVDSHNDKTVRNIFGSIQHMRVDAGNGELYGVPVFASDAESQTIMQRMAEGHITDFSITGQPLETLFVQRGQSYTTSRGMIIDGPALIHTKWQPQNASICATGADEQSTVRRSYTDLNRKVIRMNPELLAKLSAMGLPDGVVDPDQVLAWVIGKVGETSEPMEPVESMATDMPAAEVPAVVPSVEKMAEPPVDPSVARQAVEQQIKRALEQDQARRKEIQAACTLAKVERAFADELCDKLVPLSEARKRIIERMATQPLGTSVGGDVRVTQSADDKFYAAARDGIIKRSFASSGFRKPIGDLAPGHEDFERTKLGRLAEMIVERMGGPVSRMAPKDIALAAMGHGGTLNRYRIERSEQAYHTTGSFPALLMDAANKSLLAGYEEAPYTWNMWARQGQSVDDMKNINRIRFSAMGSPEVVPEGHDYPESKTGDEKETYRVEKYGSVFTVSWETIVNDDLDALSRVPAMQGASCRRKQNQVVYSVLTANAAMADTGTLFNSTAQTTAGGHNNSSGAAAAPSVTTLNAGYLSMMTKTGITVNGVAGPILNIQPSYLIVPANYGATALQLLGSIADPAAGGSAAGNSNTLNIYGPNGSRPIKVIIEPVLDASSTTVWYLAASTSQVDTVELTFLAGEESPVLESDWNMVNDTYLFKVRQTFAAAAIDFRGLYRNAA